jgi:uncharacterized protein YbjT (DUF2867 family)
VSETSPRPTDDAATGPAASPAADAARAMTGRTVVLAGATGYLGRFVARELLARGADVRAIIRPDARDRAANPGPRLAPPLAGTPGIPGTLTLVERDVTAPGALDGVCRGADAVVSTLGATTQKVDPFDIDFRANLALLRDAEHARAAGAAPIESFLFVDALGSDSSAAGVQRAKHAFAEVLVRSEVPAQFIAATGFFSDMSEMFDMVRRRIAPRIGDGDRRINPIHGADLATFLVDRLAERAPGRWAVGGPETFTWQQIATLAATVLGTQPYSIGLPEGVLRPAGWVADRVGPRTGSLARMLSEAMTHDMLAPPFGTRRLEDHFRALAAR